MEIIFDFRTGNFYNKLLAFYRIMWLKPICLGQLTTRWLKPTAMVISTSSIYCLVTP